MTARYSLADFLTLVAVIAVSVLVLQPVILRSRDRAVQTACENHLKMIAIGAHHHHDSYGKFPGLVSDLPHASTVFFDLLPFVEQDQLYRTGVSAGNRSVLRNDVWTVPVRMYQCPGATILHEPRYMNWLATTGYAANARLFGDETGLKLDGNRKLTTITDGTSNTLMFTERYAECGGVANGWGYAHPSLFMPAIGWSSMARFQVKPVRCNPEVAQTIHDNGIKVARADGSVFTLSPRVNWPFWYHMLTPAGGEIQNEQLAFSFESAKTEELVKEFTRDDSRMSAAIDSLLSRDQLPEPLHVKLVTEGLKNVSASNAPALQQILVNQGPAMIPQLIEATKNANEMVVFRSVQCLGMFGPEAKAALSRLYELVEPLEKIPQTDLILPNKISIIQFNALIAMIQIGMEDSRHYALLERIVLAGLGQFNTPNTPFRSRWFENLYRLGTVKDRTATLQKLLLPVSTSYHRTEYLHLLRAAGTLGSAIREKDLLGVLLRYLDSSEPTRQVVAANALSELGDAAKGTEVDLIKQLGSSSAIVRLACVKALKPKASQSPEIRAALEKLANDPDAAVRSAIVLP